MGALLLVGTRKGLFLLRDDDRRSRWSLEGPTLEGWSVNHAVADPRDGMLWIGISAAGVFRSEDGGETWTPSNTGTAADFLPDDPFPEVGQCVHKVLAHPNRPGRLWQQNHCGVYATRDGGTSWALDAKGLPERAWAAVLREGMGFDADALYFGTQSGFVYARPRAGDGWNEAASHLPPVLSVEAAAWP